MPKDLFAEHGIDLLANEPHPANIHPGLLKSLGQGYLNYAKGALHGMEQAFGDIGASSINWPISGIEHLIGRQLPHVPHPNLINPNPSSFSESLGQKLGQLAGGLEVPGGVGMKTAQLANRGYQSLRAGQQLPLIAKLLAAGAGGALEGAAGNEENRGLGSLLGSTIGIAGYAIPHAFGLMKSIKSSNIANDIVNVMKQKKDIFANEFKNTLQAGEDAGANNFLKKLPTNLSVLKKAGQEKNIYGLEKYNQNPTLTNAHNAQSDLNKIVRKFSSSKSGTLERDAYNNALKFKNRLLQNISESLEKSDAPEIAEHYGNIRKGYSQELSPYLNSPTISKFIQKNPSIRATKFADKLLEEEDFLAKAGLQHPGLLAREKFNIIKKNPVAKGLAIGTAALATPFLPYAVSKALGLK